MRIDQSNFPETIGGIVFVVANHHQVSARQDRKTLPKFMLTTQSTIVEPTGGPVEGDRDEDIRALECRHTQRPIIVDGAERERAEPDESWREQ